jgi:predicted RNA-binding Zn-ribbon protein involved in translation (DUF1610 family)
MVESGKCVTIAITFECPNGHEIVRTFSHTQSTRGYRQIQEQAFEDLVCPVCGWKGTKRGIQGKGIKVL